MLPFVKCSIDTIHSNHPVYSINDHFVWCPRYSHSFLHYVEETLESEFYAIVKRNNDELRSLYISPAHVHVFLSAHPKHAPSAIASR